jgi:hypothetical protein
MKSDPINFAGLEPAAFSFIEPQPGWLPLQVAQIRFFPHFAPTSLFATEMRRLIETLQLGGSSIDVSTPHTDIVCIESQGVRLFINGSDGTFSFDPSQDSEDLSVTTMDDPCGLPEQFFQMLAEAHFKSQYREGAGVLSEIAQRLWQSLQRRFQIAIDDNFAHIYGRWRDVDARFVRIYPDQLSELTISISEVDAAIGDGTVARSVLRKRSRTEIAVYSVHVAASETATRSKGTEKERDATDALAAEMYAAMQANPPKLRRKADVATEYVRRFDISSTGFNERVWPDALERIPECNWSKPGARPIKRTGIIQRP